MPVTRPSLADIEQVPWDSFLADFKWRQGEHLSAVGVTGSGKSTLINHLLPARRHVIFLATKSRDPTVDWLRKNQNYKLVNDPRNIHPEITPRVILRPKFPHVEAEELFKLHAETFRPALNMAFRDGGWTIVIDEAAYFAEDLRLTAPMKLLWQQGRSLKTTVVAGTQRPAFVPLAMYSQARHVFFWRASDDRDIKRVSELGTADKKLIREAIPQLPEFHVLYVNTKTGQIVHTKVEI